MVLERSFVGDTGKDCSAHLLSGLWGNRAYPRRQSLLSWYNSVTQQMGLEEAVLLVTLGNLLGDSAHQVDTIALLRRWSWKGHLSVILGKTVFWYSLFRSPRRQLLGVSVLALQGLILENFHFRREWWFWNNWFLSVFIFIEAGGLERTDFGNLLLWEDAVVLKLLIFDKWYIGRIGWPQKD